jgi:acid phosphatase
MRRFRGVAAFLIMSASIATVLQASVAAAGSAQNINHLIVIFQENWSFDGLYGSFPGANGVANAGAAATQVDKNGRPYATLPQPLNTGNDQPTPDPRFPTGLPNAPFDLATYVPATEIAPSPVHRFYQEQYQIDGGKMDKFVAWTDSGGLPMSRYDARSLPIGKLAEQYTLSDNFFHSAFGGSFLNHF